MEDQRGLEMADWEVVVESLDELGDEELRVMKAAIDRVQADRRDERRREATQDTWREPLPGALVLTDADRRAADHFLGHAQQ